MIFFLLVFKVPNLYCTKHNLGAVCLPYLICGALQESEKGADGLHYTAMLSFPILALT